jgi:hypothetical protein
MCSTCFLFGPYTQAKKMFASTRYGMQICEQVVKLLTFAIQGYRHGVIFRLHGIVPVLGVLSKFHSFTRVMVADLHYWSVHCIRYELFVVRVLQLF